MGAVDIDLDQGRFGQQPMEVADVVHLIASVQGNRLSKVRQKIDLVGRKPFYNNHKRLAQALDRLEALKVKLSRTKSDRYRSLPIH
ncbi:hypothetical protein GCM10010983_11510 [Caulobacter rhizosphaerae]|nr:hypothetical protein GCM10010983_11510 [Caulobacter rhizosphaerae]